MGLALFDGLLFPLLILDGVIVWSVTALLRLPAARHLDPTDAGFPRTFTDQIAGFLQVHPELPIIVAALVAISVSAVIVILSWRAVNRAASDPGEPIHEGSSGTGLLALGILSLGLGPLTALPGLVLSRKFRPFSPTALVGYVLCWLSLALSVLACVAAASFYLWRTEIRRSRAEQAVTTVLAEQSEKIASGAVGARQLLEDSGVSDLAISGVLQAMEIWMSEMDAGNYAQTWRDASSLFKSAISEANWVASLTNFRKPLGALVSRKLSHAQSAGSLPGVPDGEYVVMQFRTTFAAKKEAVETVTFSHDADRSWKASGYYIK